MSPPPLIRSKAFFAGQTDRWLSCMINSLSKLYNDKNINIVNNNLESSEVDLQGTSCAIASGTSILKLNVHTYRVAALK